MKVNKTLLAVLSIFLIALVFISSASAADTNKVTDLSIDESGPLKSNEDIGFTNSEDGTVTPISNVANSTVGTYTDLQKLIDESNKTIDLDKNYEYNAKIDGKNFTKGVAINKELVIDGKGYSISGNNAYRIFNIGTNANVELKNINFINSNDRAVYFKSIGSVENCTFENNIASSGAALYFENYGVVSKSTFKGNNATTSNGGAICFDKNGTVSDCNFIDNNAKLSGGAIYFGGNGPSTLVNSVFTTNTAGSSGGAVFFSGSKKGTGNVDECQFVNNTAIVKGNAIYISSGNISNTNITDDDDSAYSIYSSGTLALNNNIVPNGIQSDGTILTPINAIVCDGKTCTVNYGEHVLFNATVTDNDGNPIYDSNLFFTVAGNNITAFIEDGIYGAEYTFKQMGEFNVSMSSSKDKEFTVTPATFKVNAPIMGTYTDLQKLIDDAPAGQILVLPHYYEYNAIVDGDSFPKGVIIDKDLIIDGDDYTIVGNGHRIFDISKDANVELKNINFINSNNRAVYFRGTGSVDNCNFTGNTATGGSALYFEGYGVVSNSTFTDNTATTSNGGAICFDGNGTVSDCTFINNEAKLSGGAIYFGGNGPSTVVNSKFTSNTAGSSGGAVFFSGSKKGTGNVTNCNFKDNTAAVKGNAIYISSGEISGSTFTDNGRDSSYAIYTSGTLALNKNKVSNGIYNDGTITTPIKVTVCKGKTYNVKYGEVVSLNATVTDNDGNYIYDSSFYFTVEGNNITATPGDKIYTADYTFKVIDEVSVGMGSLKDTDLIVKNATFNVAAPSIIAEDLVKMYKNDTQYKATFFNETGAYLPDGTVVKFYLNGKTYERKISGGKGEAGLNINLSPGIYQITAENPVIGDNLTTNITVLSTVTGNKDITKYYKNDTQYSVKILGADGKAVGAGEIVTFNVNGIFYNRTTDENGIATLNINLPPSDYVITADYNGCKVANNIKVLPVLSASDITMKYMDGTQFLANLVDGHGKPYAEQTVKFNINGVEYNRVTDSNGQAALNIRLIPGEYIITSTFNGASIANKITIEGVF